jgi:hypothetical protein
MDEADCYNCMYGMVRDRSGYLAQTKKADKVMKYVLRDLAKKYAVSVILNLTLRYSLCSVSSKTPYP